MFSSTCEVGSPCFVNPRTFISDFWFLSVLGVKPFLFNSGDVSSHIPSIIYIFCWWIIWTRNWLFFSVRHQKPCHFVHPQCIPGESHGYELRYTTMTYNFRLSIQTKERLYTCVLQPMVLHLSLPVRARIVLPCYHEYPVGVLRLFSVARPTTRHLHRHIIRISDLKYDVLSMSKHV